MISLRIPAGSPVNLFSSEGLIDRLVRGFLESEPDMIFGPAEIAGSTMLYLCLDIDTDGMESWYEVLPVQ